MEITFTWDKQRDDQWVLSVNGREAGYVLFFERKLNWGAYFNVGKTVWEENVTFDEAKKWLENQINKWLLIDNKLC